MTKSAPKTNRWVKPVLLLSLLGGLSTLLYFQRRQIDLERQEIDVSNRQNERSRLLETIQRRNLQPDPISPMTVEQLQAAISRHNQDLTYQLNERLEWLYDEANDAHSEFELAFGPSGRLRALVVPNPKATTTAEYNEQYERYCARDIELYLTHTSDQGESKERGEAFFRKSHACKFQNKTAPTAKEMEHLAEEILSSPTSDPFLRGRALEWIYSDNGDESLKDRIEKEVLASLAQLLNMTYPPFAEVSLRHILKRRTSSDDIVKIQRLESLNMSIVKWIKDEAPDAQWHRCITRRLFEITGHPCPGNVMWHIANDRELPRYIQHVLAGEYYLDYAGYARGTKYANDVTRDQWSKFNNYNDLAKVHLRRAWLLRPDYPFAASLMIRATMGGSDENRTTADWFQKSIDAQFDYESAYSQYLLSLLPRWRGSEAAMLAFGQDCVATRRFDTYVPYNALEVIYKLEHFEKHPKDRLFTDIPAAKLLLDDLCLNRANWLRENNDPEKMCTPPAFPARPIEWYLAYQLPRAAQQAALTAPDNYQPQWPLHLYHDGAYEVAKLKAMTDTTRLPIERVEHTLLFDRSITLSEEAQNQLNADWSVIKENTVDPKAQPFLKHIETMIQQRKDFSLGQWVDLLKGPESSGWEFYGQEVSYNESTQLWTVRGNDQFHHPTGGRPLIALQFPLEVEMDATVPAMPNLSFNDLVKGIAWSPPRIDRREKDKEIKQEPAYFLFGITYADSMGVMATYPRDRNWINYGPTNQLEPAQKLRLKLWETACEFHVNQFSYCGPLWGPLDPTWFLTFGEMASNSYYHSKDNGEFSLGNVRVRKLTTTPIPDKSVRKSQRIAYWQQRIDEDSADYLAMRELAKCLLHSAPERTVELCRRVLEAEPDKNGMHSLLAAGLFILGQREEGESELKLAESLDRYEAVNAMAAVERVLTDSEATPEMLEGVEYLARTLKYNGEECLSQKYQARLKFGQHNYQQAVDFIRTALPLADEEEAEELRQLQQQYETALQESLSEERK
ncbi:MAG: hypothetical protein O2955_07810 [Planctomycetota bacterium]|nr:hypothetical protein [Planctomycetota bacterium]MDA1212406.1 hypothetical protein [Planctomycetota bacterium]